MSKSHWLEKILDRWTGLNDSWVRHVFFVYVISFLVLYNYNMIMMAWRDQFSPWWLLSWVMFSIYGYRYIRFYFKNNKELTRRLIENVMDK